MRTRLIHLINPKTDRLTTRPLYFNRALYSPLAGLLAVAAAIPRDQYEVRWPTKTSRDRFRSLLRDLVGISAMTAYVNRGYEIADAYRARGMPVIMGGVHPSFMPQGGAQPLRCSRHRRGGARHGQSPGRLKRGCLRGLIRRSARIQ